MAIAMAASTGGCSRANPAEAKPKRSPIRATPAGPMLANGSIPLWQQFKAGFLQADGRIVDSGNHGISHSEGQGYGLLLAEAAGDREAFDRILGWTERLLARKFDALFSWRYVPDDPNPVADPNDASDGDMLIGWALTRAAARWNDRRYAGRAAQIRKAIHDLLLRETAGQTYLLPGLSGFETGGSLTLNPSYYIWPALRLFQQVDGETAWGPVIAGGEALIRRARFGPLSLPTDWVEIDGQGGAAPARGKPPLFGFDAIRVPLYLMMDGRQAEAAALGQFWRSYASRGMAVPATVNVVTGEVAPYPLSPGAMLVVARLLGQPAPPINGIMTDYYSSVLGQLCLLH